MKSILFLTSTNLAANPRLVKELKLATDNGFEATLVQFSVGNWSDAMTADLQQQFPEVKFIQLSALRRPLMPWLLSTAFYKLSNIIPLNLRGDWMLSVSAGKRSYLLLQALKKIDRKFDWVIAHNPAAFYPAYWYGKKKAVKIGIDVEDYHPGETNDKGPSENMKELMKRILPAAEYRSFASPLIMEYVEQDVPSIKGGNNQVVNNVFSKHEFPVPIAEHRVYSKLRFVWFSQFIDYGRGLEQLLPVMDKFQDSLELTLIGSANNAFLENEVVNRSYIRCLSSLAQVNLHQQLHNYDIGLAIEDSGANLNRNICLTNKIWAFLQAGLYIGATPTDAQRIFLSQHPLHGEVIVPENMEKTLHDLVKRKEELINNKLKRYEKACDHSWEGESAILLTEWNLTKRRTSNAF